MANSPWGGGNDQGGQSNSPWNKPDTEKPKNGGGSDLEAQMKRMQEKFMNRRRGGGGGKRGGRGGAGFGAGGAAILVAVAGLAWLSTGVVVVDAGEQASVFTFGEFRTNFDAGINVRWPYPIETHEIVPVEERQELSIGASEDESLMLTADENIVDIEFSVFWKVKSQAPQDYVLNVKQPKDAVRRVSESVMREVVGRSPLQNLITDGREAVQQEVESQAQNLLDEYRAGVQLLDVQIRKADPPEPVIEAFNDVNVAEQDAEKVINEARREANRIVPEARGTAERLLREAEGYRDSVIAEANGEAQRFNLNYQEYRLAPRVTRERMFLETLEEVLSKSNKIVLDSNAGAVPYLPLDRTTPRRGQ